MLKVMKESRSNNYKENIAYSFPAIQHVLALLMSTTYGSMPYALGLGFEIKDIIFKVNGSEEEQNAINDFNNQLRSIVGDEEITVNFSRDGTEVSLIINFVYDKENRKATIPIVDLGDSKFDISVKDIIVE